METPSTFPKHLIATNLSTRDREKVAWEIRKRKTFPVPTFDFWNYSPCYEHIHGWEDRVFNKEGKLVKTMVYDIPNPSCHRCGVIFRKHQKVGIMWMYYKKRGLLADTMGVGKTIEAAGLIAMLLLTKEVPERGRIVVCPQAPSIYQWAEQLARVMPSLNIAVADGKADFRARLYAEPWEVLIIGPEMLRNDYQALMNYDIACFIVDDVDPLRHDYTDTSKILDGFGTHAGRYYIMNGTPQQKKLDEMHSVLDAVGGLKVFGPKESFVKRYVREVEIKVPKMTGPNTYVEETKTKVIGHKNMPELRRKMAPLFLRRTVADLDDVTMPVMNPEDILLSMYPEQWARYRDLQRDIVLLRNSTEGTEQTRHVTALSKLTYGAAICAGIGTLDGPEEDGPGKSVKLDWVQSKVVDGELSDEKVVIFADRQNTVMSLQKRLEENGVGYATVWGKERNKRVRAAAQQRFWDDKNCRVFIGTRAIERSLNLQVSRYLINVDTIMNQARMNQLAGRITRIGSEHPHVFIYNLLTINTQEERIMPLLEREAALAGAVFGESSELFRQLSTTEMYDLIGVAA